MSESIINSNTDLKYDGTDGSLSRLIELSAEYARADAELEEFKENNDEVLKEKKRLEANSRNAERELRATLARYLQKHGAIDPADASKDNPVALFTGLDYQVGEEVHYDQSAVDAWARKFAPYLLEVKWSAFEDMAKAHSAYDKYKSRQPGVSVPATIVRTITPVVKSTNSDDPERLHEWLQGDDNRNALMDDLTRRLSADEIADWLDVWCALPHGELDNE